MAILDGFSPFAGHDRVHVMVGVRPPGKKHAARIPAMTWRAKSQAILNISLTRQKFLIGLVPAEPDRTLPGGPMSARRRVCPHPIHGP